MVVSRGTLGSTTGLRWSWRRTLVSRATTLAVTLLAAACDHPARSAPADASHSQPTSTVHQIATPALDAAGSLPPPSRSSLSLAYPEQPLSPAEFERLLLRLAASHDPDETTATVLALAHRAPTEQLTRLWAAVPASQLNILARGLAGRTPSRAPHDLPPALLQSADGAGPIPALATLIQRFHLPLRLPYDPQRLLFAAAEQDQVSGARLLAAPGTPLPPASALIEVPALAIPALARSLTQRTDAPPETIVTLLNTLATRAQLAPRQWGNAWRALRDALPLTNPAFTPALLTATQMADAAPLTDRTGSWWRCENAIVADKITGRLDRTLHCADPMYPWIAATAQAQVLPALHLPPANLAAQLTALLAAEIRPPSLLAAIAAAAVTLPPAQARPLLRALANEHDPGTLAATLEALNEHPDLAATLPAGIRDPLLQGPFDLPEGPALEARIEALRLAHTLHAQSVLEHAPDSSVRAIQLALHPDAGILPESDVPAPLAVPPVIVRITTDVGAIELELFPSQAPRAVAQVLDAVRSHRYDGLTFHRVVPGFVIQGGDPRGDGYGGTESPTTTELSLRPFERGSIGIPLAGLDTGGIQLFVVLADAPHLDGRYPWVGRVRRGMDVVDAMLVGDHLRRVEVVEGDR